MAIQQMMLGAGGGDKTFYKDTWSGIPTWTTTYAAYGGGNSSVNAYGSGIDTYGDYIVYAPRGQANVNIYELSSGNLATSINCGTTNWNSYGIGMDSTRGWIFTTSYGSNNVMKLDISSSCTNNSDGTKLTFSSTSISATVTTGTSNIAPWAVINNEDRCDFHQHIFLPHDTTHYMHDTWLISGRGLGRETLVFPAGPGYGNNYKKVIDWPSSSTSGVSGDTVNEVYGGSYDWATNSLLINKRDHTELLICHDNTNAKTLNTSNMYSHAERFSTSVSGFTSLEDAHIMRDGRLVLSRAGQQNWYVLDRTA